MQTLTSTTLIELEWTTNYNKKLGNIGFLHVDLLGKKTPASYEDLEGFVFKIKTQDESHPPVNYIMVDILKFEADRLTDTIALASHGVTAMELIDEMFKKYATWFSLKTVIACYCYRKI